MNILLKRIIYLIFPIFCAIVLTIVTLFLAVLVMPLLMLIGIIIVIKFYMDISYSFIVNLLEEDDE